MEAIDLPTTAFVLGAGFSAAVASLPTANELGNRAYQVAEEAGGGARSRRKFSLDFPFELALSLLAEKQPHLSEVQNRRNALQLAELTAAIAVVLERAQDVAFAQEPKPWVYELMSVLNEWHSTIVSLNQDLVIETTVESHYLEPTTPRPLSPHTTRLEYFASVGAMQKVNATDLLWHVPPVAGGLPAGAANRARSMRLLKLHGSVDWWWAPPDPTGATILREGIYGRFGAPTRMSDQDRRDLLPGRERFIAPPVVSKSTYFDNPITRQLWQDAFESLRNAERIALVGYSLPSTDHMAFGLLQSVLEGRDVRLDVVNRNVKELRPRLKALVGVRRSGQLPSWVHCYEGIDAIEQYAHEIANGRSRELIQGLEESLPPSETDRTVHVRWPRSNGITSYRVFAIDGPDERGTVTLKTARVRPEDEPDERTGYDPTVEDSRVALSDVLKRLDKARSLVATHGNGAPMPLVNYVPNTRWITFVPAGIVL